MFVDELSDGHDELFGIVKHAAPQSILGKVAEEALPMFSHELLVGVKWT